MVSNNAGCNTRGTDMAKHLTNETIRLANLLTKYAHRWNEEPSTRMYKWVDDLNDLISKLKRYHTQDWNDLCEAEGWDKTCNAYDFLA